MKFFKFIINKLSHR